MRPPSPVVVVCESWPSVLAALEGLRVRVEGAYFPANLHRFFKPNRAGLVWHPPPAFASTSFRKPLVTFISGSLQFIEKYLPSIPCPRQVVVCVEFRRRTLSKRALIASMNQAEARLRGLDLLTVRWSDELCGGVTDAWHLFAIGRDVGAERAPQALPNLRRAVDHYLSGSVGTFRGSFVDKASVPTDLPPRPRVLWHNGVVRADGLFPCHSPRAQFYCPNHYKPDHWERRQLAWSELLRVFQVPLKYDDDIMRSFDVSKALPFEKAPPTDVLTAFLRQLWGKSEGGRQQLQSADTSSLRGACTLPACMPKVATINNEMGIVRCPSPSQDGARVDVTEDTVANNPQPTKECSMTRQKEGIGTGRWLVDAIMEGDELIQPSRDSQTSSVSSSSTDTSSTGLPPPLIPRDDVSSTTDTSCSSHKALGDYWENLQDRETESRASRDLENQSICVFEDHELLEPLFDKRAVDNHDRMEDSTITTHASEDTCVTGSSSVRIRPRLGGDSRFIQPGAPFAVGEVLEVMLENQEPQRGFVVEADDPWYVLEMEDGTTRQLGAYEGCIMSRSCRDQEPEDLFLKSKQRKELKIGSYGVQLDAQKIALKRIREEKEFAKAVKADDAAVPVYLWNQRVTKSGVTPEERDDALSKFREFGFRWFMRGLRRDCSDFLATRHGTDWHSKPREVNGKLTDLGRDHRAIRNMLWHATNTKWFEYNAGSRLVHFRFPIRYRRVARDGVKVYFETAGPSTKEQQPPIPDPERRKKVRSKMFKVLDRRYMLSTGLNIKSLIKFFDVDKGETDIRIVYDATANMLNSCVWVPSFWLPTIESLIRVINENSWMTDRDIADMFLNFQLDEAVKPFTGVDLSSIYEEGEPIDPKWAYWDRNLMGFAASPHNSVLMSLVVEEIIKGNRFDTRVGADGKELNPFQWFRVELNLPGTKNYNPSRTWICKLRKDGLFACEMLTFVDDERIAGPTRELTWQASHRVACIQAYLGIQDAARKVRPCSQTPGAWAGAVVHIFQQLGVCTLTSEEKWAKLKALLKKWYDLLSAGETELAHKELMSDRGFLVYVTRTYPAMVPYLKGFHLTIEMWRGGRDADGWKLKDDASIVTATSIDSLDATRGGAHGVDLDKASSYSPNQCEDEDEAAMDHRLCTKIGSERVYAPSSGFTTAVPRLLDDVKALRELTDFELPPLRVVRPSMVVSVFYGFGDASGKEFGSTLSDDYNCRKRLSKESAPKEGVTYRIGVWTAAEREESSNFKELCNLVESTEKEAYAGKLRNCEFFLFTDNSTAESCYYRGTSSSKVLHSLVLRLRKLEMKFGMQIHIIHVSGKRMIAQGTDGASRGSLMEGVLAGQDMLSFIDLAKTAVERHPPLLDWIRSWTGLKDLEPLTPEGWFEEGHGIIGGSEDQHGVWIPKHGPSNRLFLWAPQPAVADAALEELLKARHKRTDTFHVVVLPRLMTPRWRRLFNKVCDFTFVVPPDVSFWPASMFEPLWVGIILPFTHHRPWCFKRAPLLVELGRDLRRMLPTREEDAGNLLRKLLLLPRRIRGLSQRQACGVLHMPWDGRNVSNVRGEG